ncbi:MAG: M20/M25/M40 family metallo-hydrolase [Planctomycetes bacterium]|nr:M20/M25/M40 family metallo-hydrolase [Planctomycetota bacterium]
MTLSTTEQRLCGIIEARADALLDDLKRHVGIATGPGGKAGLDETREVFIGRLRALGARIDLKPGDPKPDWLLGGDRAGAVPPAAVCTRPTSNGTPPTVLIAGHLDTVHEAASGFCSLNIAPDGETATGPGCVDMKGGLVIAMAALESLQQAGLDTAWTFILTSDEETGSFHSARALREQAARHEFGLVLEPALAGGELAIERMGSGQFMIEARGKAAHVGRAFTQGVSAVTALAKAVVAVSEMPEPDQGRILSVGPLTGGTATNAVPDLARAWGNCRFTTRQDAAHIARMLDDLQTPGDQLPSVRLRRVFNRPAKPLTDETEALALRARAVAEDLGQKLPFAATGGVCDGNILQDAGLATIDTLGVRGGGLHTSSEWIELPSLVERCKLLAVLIHRLSTDAPDTGGA